MSNWDDLGKEFERGPQGAYRASRGLFPFAFKVALLLMSLSFVIGVAGSIFGWFNQAVEVVGDELGPKALLEKYEWFKEASAQLDKKMADIQVYQSKLDDLSKSYGDKSRSDWDRTDKQTYSQWVAEVAGTVASYNALSAEYNAQMAKVNWRFANVGSLPQGASVPLPREYKPYLER